MNNDIIGVLSKEVEKLDQNVEQLNQNMNQLVKLFDGLTQRTLHLEDAMDQMEVAMLRLIERGEGDQKDGKVKEGSDSEQ